MKFIAASFITLFGLIASAGEWVCQAGLDGKVIVNLKMSGTETGQFGDQANISIAGAYGGNLSVMQDATESGEFARAIIGSEDPRSKLRLRVMNEQIGNLNYKAFVLLMNFPIKQELDGNCQYSP